MKISSKIKLQLRSLLLKCGAINTDKGQLLFDGEELEVGMEVFVTNEEGEIVAAPDGEYVGDAKTYVVADGKVSEIKENETAQEPETESESEAETEPEADPNPEADPADDVQGEADDETVEDRLARAEAALAEIREGIEALTNAIAALNDRLTAAEDKIRGLDEPGADPAEQGEETEEKFTSKLNYLKRNR